MEFREDLFHCSTEAYASSASLLEEVRDVLRAIAWAPEFSVETRRGTVWHQRAYNLALADGFTSRGWARDVVLCERPMLRADFAKESAAVEVQFGNSAVVFRDYYKFRSAHLAGRLKLAVLIVPCDPCAFFPTRPGSVASMANRGLAVEAFSQMPILAPTAVIGLVQGGERGERIRTGALGLHEGDRATRGAPVGEEFPFEEACLYHRRQEVHSLLGGNVQSGIVTLRERPFVLLFSSSKGPSFGYEDGWLSAERYQYTGEGWRGDMAFVRGNRAVRDHKRERRSLHLFTHYEGGRYEYQGEFEYESHEIRRAPDREGKPRDVIVFRLRHI